MSARRRYLTPLVPLYAAGLRWKKWLLSVGRLKRNRLSHVVISVGSLSAGGAGKTPVVLMLADILRRRDYAVRILTRGYGRTSTRVERVEPLGDPARYGDEPILLAQRSGAPVYVGADRYKAGLMAADLPTEKIVVNLLDDGFQHRRLARDLDIVLVTAHDVLDTLLPAGDLREPLSALVDADVVMIREDEVAEVRDHVIAATREKGVPPLWLIRRRLELSDGLVTVPERPLVFCGIARPENFTAMLEEQGVRGVATVVYPDHYAYTDRDITQLLDGALESGADGFITTEKDAVKLSRGMRSRLEWAGPLIISQLSVELVDEKGSLEQMIAMVKRLDRRRGR